jgi:ABC-type multidrug transport system ATPase subunit
MILPLLSFDSFGKRFGQKTVLRSASLWGTPGCVAVLLGRNGSGKSTLIRAGPVSCPGNTMAFGRRDRLQRASGALRRGGVAPPRNSGAIPRRRALPRRRFASLGASPYIRDRTLGRISADHGTTRWDGEIWRRPCLDELARRGLFFLPDRGLLSRRLALADQIGFFAAAYGGDADAAVEALDLGALMELRAGQLSGGEERRAEMALARLRAPRCLIADEPFAGLAPTDRARIAGELGAHARRGAAVIVTGHEVEDLLAIADEVVWMVAGTTHVLGPPAAARTHDQFRREYLGGRAPGPPRARETGTASPAVDRPANPTAAAPRPARGARDDPGEGPPRPARGARDDPGENPPHPTTNARSLPA